MNQIGGIVVGPIMAQSRSGRHGTRLAHQPGGLILDLGNQNRGVDAAVRKFSTLWESLPCAVIVQVADTTLHNLVETCTILREVSGCAAIELLIPDEAPIKAVRSLIETALSHCDVPLLIRLPLMRSPRLAAIAVESGAETLVIGEPSIATLPLNPPHPIDALQLLSGRYHGPANFAWMLNALTQISASHPHTTLVAGCGIHSPQMAQTAIQTGAHAIALDSLVWVDPCSIAAIARAI